MECDTREIKQNHIARDQTGPPTAFQVTADKFTIIQFASTGSVQKDLILTAYYFLMVLVLQISDLPPVATAKHNTNLVNSVPRRIPRMRLATGAIRGGAAASKLVQGRREGNLKSNAGACST